MHIILGLVAILGAVGLVLWRLHMASEAAKGLAETASDVKGFLRKRKWQKKLANDPLQLVDDSRVAATIMMIALAQHDGAVTQAEQSAIIGQMMEKVYLPKDGSLPYKNHEWATTGKVKARGRNIITSLHIAPDKMEQITVDKKNKKCHTASDNNQSS